MKNMVKIMSTNNGPSLYGLTKFTVLKPTDGDNIQLKFICHYHYNYCY